MQVKEENAVLRKENLALRRENQLLKDDNERMKEALAMTAPIHLPRHLPTSLAKPQILIMGGNQRTKR